MNPYPPVFEKHPDPVLLSDASAQVVYWNRAARTLLGAPVDVETQVEKERTRKAFDAWFGSLFRECMEAMTCCSRTIVPHHGGSCGPSLHVTVTPIYANGRAEGAWAICRQQNPVVQESGPQGDVSLSKRSACVAHEINNPLSGILLFADLLMKRVGEDAQARADVREIMEQALRCKSIVRNLLGSCRKPAGDKEGFDVNEALHESLQGLKSQVSLGDIRVQCLLQPQIPQLVGDRVQIQQVFTNLLCNAVDALQGKGSIFVTTRYDCDCGGFVITFRDTGPGIRERDKGKIFDCFFTTKPVGSGTGLGLSISREIVQSHGGSVSAENHPDGGANFTVLLPGGQP